ncbi:MAG: serpin family protein [Bacillota bacterium]
MGLFPHVTVRKADTAVQLIWPKQQNRPVRTDIPFFFTIRDNESGTVLFMGSVIDPRF